MSEHSANQTPDPTSRTRLVELLSRAAHQLLDGHIDDHQLQSTVANLVNLDGHDLDDAMNVLCTAVARDDSDAIADAAQQVVDEHVPSRSDDWSTSG